MHRYLGVELEENWSEVESKGVLDRFYDEVPMVVVQFWIVV